MNSKALDTLPTSITNVSISQSEIVLPLKEALNAIDILESKGILILGWEGWIKTIDGRVGHGSAPQGTLSLEDLSVKEAADVCRKTIPEDAKQWNEENKGTSDVLHFCITIHT